MIVEAVAVLGLGVGPPVGAAPRRHPHAGFTNAFAADLTQ